MSRILSAGFITIICVTCLSVRTQAQVNTYTDMFRYDWDGHNEMVGVAYTSLDYSANEDYCVYIDNYFYRMENGAQVDERYAYGSGCHTFTEAAAFFPIIEGSDYAVDGEFTVESIYTYDDCYYCGFDPYGYGYYHELYLDGEPVFTPWWHPFYGTGYPARASTPYFFLGVVFSYLQSGSLERSGPPHHLYAVTDRTITLPAEGDCTFPRANRLVDFLVVDSNNRHAGRVPLREEPHDPPLVDSCSNRNVKLTQCTTEGISPFGNFTDEIRTGCPNAGTTPDCGVGFGNRWQWCANYGWSGSRTYVNLAWMYYDLRRSVINLDGQLDISGTHKY